MSARSLSSRFALWLAVCALLLKGAAPLLASVAAQSQGKAVAEVCTVYGVVLADARLLAGSKQASANSSLQTGDERSTPSHDPQAPPSHAGDHCALSALLAFAGPAEPPVVQPMAAHVAEAPLARALVNHAPDASARWAAQLRHAPPALG